MLVFYAAHRKLNSIDTLHSFLAGNACACLVLFYFIFCFLFCSENRSQISIWIDPQCLLKFITCTVTVKTILICDMNDY